MKKIFNQSENVKISGIILALILVVIIYDWPIFNKIKEWHANLNAEAAGLEAQNQQGNSFTKASLDYQQFTDKLPPPETLLKPGGQELELIKQLEQISDQNKLAQELTLGQNRQDWSDKIEVLGLSAKLTGQFGDIIRYLENLEKLNFQLTVDAVQLKPDALATGSGLVEAQLLLNTYWLKNR